jgi:hypothetical protein
MADATQFLEYDSDSNEPDHHHNKPPFKTSENKWILRYQQLFQLYLNHHHCEVPRNVEMATLADCVLYQRPKFKSDPHNYDYHRLNLLKGIKKIICKRGQQKGKF